MVSCIFVMIGIRTFVPHTGIPIRDLYDLKSKHKVDENKLTPIVDDVLLR